MKRKSWLIVGLVIVAMLSLIEGYVLLSNGKKDFTEIPTNSSVENSTVYFLEDKEGAINGTKLLAMHNISFNEIPHNTKPAFKVGDMFEYVAYNPKSSIERGLDYTSHSTQRITYSVVKKEKLKGIECYVIEGVNLFLLNESDPMSSGTVSRETYYISTETGKIIKIISSGASIEMGVEMNKKEFFADIPSEISEVSGAIFYSPWMLSLDDEFKMEIKTFNNGRKIETTTIKVVGRDKIKNRESYKIERRIIDEDNQVISRDIMWVDVKKRILIKNEGYYENLKVGSLELVSELK